MANSKPVSRLGAVRRGPLNAPLRYLIYGTAGVGKSTLAAYSDAPIIFDVEDGTERLDVARYPFTDGPNGHVPQTFDQLLAAVHDLTTAPHEYKTLVIDTVDRVEALIWAHCCKRDGKANIPAYGYGKGEIVALDEWRLLCRALDDLRLKRGMTIVLLGHSQIKKYDDPEGEGYDRHQLKVQKLAAGFLVEWPDLVMFATFEEGGSKLDGSDKAKGFITGRRMLRTERGAAHDAKSRVPLPPEIDLVDGDPWALLAEAVEAGRSMPAKTLITLIEQELIRLSDDNLTAQVKPAVKKAAENTAELTRYLMNLKSKQPKEQA